MSSTAQPVEVMAMFGKENVIRPIRFHIPFEGNMISVNVEQLINIDKTEFEGKPGYSFKCKSIIGGMQRLYELRYDIQSRQWFFRM